MDTVWIDTHVHLDASCFEHDLKEVRQRALAAGVKHCIIPSVEVSGFDAVRRLAHGFGDFYALGIHPLYTDRAQSTDLAHLEQVLMDLKTMHPDPRLVAVGEIGLDGFVKGLDWERQEHFFQSQLKLANRCKLPTLLHVRKSADALLKNLRRLGTQGGIAHAFNGSLAQARTFIDLGFALGFGGAMTHERATHLRELLRSVPLSAIVLETDAPDIQPQWLYVPAADRALGKPQARNEPQEIVGIARFAAETLGLSMSQLAQITLDNVVHCLRMDAHVLTQPTLLKNKMASS